MTQVNPVSTHLDENYADGSMGPVEQYKVCHILRKARHTLQARSRVPMRTLLVLHVEVVGGVLLEGRQLVRLLGHEGTALLHRLGQGRLLLLHKASTKTDIRIKHMHRGERGSSHIMRPRFKIKGTLSMASYIRYQSWITLAYLSS